MQIKRLFIKDFMCHANSYIDFSQFNIALIVGKMENNDSVSNGVGKSTIFKAIEYVLFNEADIHLEDIIRDDTESATITIDIFVDNEEYRISRIRTKKSSDLTLYKRNAVDGDESKVYFINDSPITNKKYWQDISGRRTADTEKELEKLIKLNFKSFRNTIHFMQNDFSGLATTTPEKRKLILKDALSLTIYSKLEKATKEKISLLSKDIDKYKIIIDNLGYPKDDLEKLNSQLLKLIDDISILETKLTGFENEKNASEAKLNKLLNLIANLEIQQQSLILSQVTVENEINKLTSIVVEYSAKRSSIAKQAQTLVSEIESLKNDKIKLNDFDFSKIELLNNDIANLKDKISKNNIIIQHNISKLEELKIPIPNENICKHCRQELTNEHKQACKQEINKEILNYQQKNSICKKEIDSFNIELTSLQKELVILVGSKQSYDKIDSIISSKEKEIKDKKELYSEYNFLVKQSSKDFDSKKEELNRIKLNIIDITTEDYVNTKSEILKEQAILLLLNQQISTITKEFTHFTNNKAIISSQIDLKTKDKIKKEDFEKKLFDLEIKHSKYISVLQAFSSTGIPNLIIQNMLDDLQVETNLLLNQLKSGLQLSFVIEKINSNKVQDETLDIIYSLNGKKRVYDQLSGAMKLAVMFSLKLGLSFVLQKMMGVDIKFLLLDEIDQSLDKSTVDSFADIVKIFQKDFTILIITHNDRLKDKFAHAILVEQNSNLISTAKVVSAW